MKSASFHLAVYDAYRVDGRSLTVFLRNLKEAGLITSGGRGRHAPHMQPVDAARITIALLATDKPARAVDRLERFGKLTFQPSESKGPFPDALGIEEGSTFEKVLTNLFSSDLDEDDVFTNAPYIEVQENSRRATIEFSNADGKSGAVFRNTSRTEEQRNQDRGELFGIRQSRGLASAELMKLYVPFYCERRDGKSWEEIEDEMEARSQSESGNSVPVEVMALLEPYVARNGDADE